MVTEQKTRCPHCQTVFRVTRTQLEAASGMVRCGKCFNTFNGFDGLIADHGDVAAPLPPVPENESSFQEDDDFLIDDNFDLSRLAKNNSTQNVAVTSKNITDKSENDDISHEISKTEPQHGNSDSTDADHPEDVIFTLGSPVSIAAEELEELGIEQGDMSRWRPETHNIIPDAGLIGRHPSDRKNPFTWLWIVGSLCAAVALALQLIYFNSLTIDRDSPLWSLSSRACATLGCPLPKSVDVDKILSTNLVIRNHPQAADALLVDAIIVNTADFAQPFPPLTLAFENLQGDVVAQRTFLPKDYLMGELAGLQDMPDGKPVKLELEIIDPGKDAVSFQFYIAK